VLAANRGRPTVKRLLYLAHRVPYPPDKGERVRAYHEINALCERFEVTVACLAHRPSEHASARALAERCAAVHVGRVQKPIALVGGAWSLLAGRSVTEGYFRDRRWLRGLRRAAGTDGYDLVFAYCSSMLPEALAIPARARAIDLVDVDSAKWRQYARESTGPMRWLHGLEARRVEALERRAVEAFDLVTLVSADEARALPAGGPNVHPVANGVDTDYFRPPDVRPDGAPTAVFTGTMDYRPNIEAVCWFAKHVWPGVRLAHGAARFVIVGRDPAPAVRRLVSSPGVEVTGTVADVRPYLHSASLAVAPLRIARGVQNKVLEAMSSGLAVVGSPEALEGIGARAGEEVVEARQPGQWVERVGELFQDPGRRLRIGDSARRYVLAHARWERRMGELTDLCESLLAGAERACCRQ
jgi:sugar transferase (PEP-CTERM/EpsH1 system associated)